MENNSEPAQILVGVDGSDSSIEALRGAAKIAAAMHAHLRVVIAWDYPPMLYQAEGWSPESDAQTVLSTALTHAFGADLPAGLKSSVLHGPAARILIEQSEDFDLLVLGNRGHGGFAGLLLGSVSTTCAQHARCPVLITHHAEDSKITGSPQGRRSAAATS